MKERIEAIDFIKGCLLVCMTMIHVEQLFLEEIGSRAAFNPFIRFTTRGFVFFSGFVVAYHYYDKWLGARRFVSRRLIVRGIKLCLIFLVPNLAMIGCFKILRPGLSLGAATIIADPLYTFGVSSKVAVFEILVPIGYVLMLSPLALLLAKKGWWLQLLIGVLLLFPLLSLLGMDMYYNLQNLLYGLAGIAAGYFLKGHKSSLAWFATGRLSGAVITAGLFFFYLVLSLAGTMNVHRSVAGGWFHMGWIIATQTFLFRASVVAGRIPVIHRAIIEFGRYSLFFYIFQIISLRFIDLISFPLSGWPLLGLVFCLNLAAVWIAVKILDVLVRSSRIVDRAYRAIFA